MTDAKQDGLNSAPDFHSDDVEQLAFELAFELEEAELSPNNLVSVNRDKLRTIAARVLSRVSEKASSNQIPEGDTARAASSGPLSAGTFGDRTR